MFAKWHQDILHNDTCHNATWYICFSIKIAMLPETTFDCYAKCHSDRCNCTEYHYDYISSFVILGVGHYEGHFAGFPYAERHYAECRMLSAIMLSAIMLSIIKISIIQQSIVILSVIMLYHAED
jgi:hypothetical protein